MIDDGGTDDSGIICDEYSSKDSRIKVFHQKNQGVYAARNVGLKNLTGNYVTFADSDDFLEPYAFQVYLYAFEKYDSDIVRTGFYLDFEDGTTDKTSIDKDMVFNNTWKLFRKTEESKYYSFLWNSCFDSKVVKNIRFDEELNWLEDHTFVYRCYLCCQTYVLVSQCTYHYVRHIEHGLAYVRAPYVLR